MIQIFYLFSTSDIEECKISIKNPYINIDKAEALKEQGKGEIYDIIEFLEAFNKSEISIEGFAFLVLNI